MSRCAWQARHCYDGEYEDKERDCVYMTVMQDYECPDCKSTASVPENTGPPKFGTCNGKIANKAKVAANLKFRGKSSRAA